MVSLARQRLPLVAGDRARPVGAGRSGRCGAGEPQTRQGVAEFHTYIEANEAFIPNYGDRYRYGEVISTAFVESTVNQVISKRMVKKQQMRWTKKGAHLLLQVRAQVLNDDLRATFERWYPAIASTDALFN